jgi:hypothetical protein
MKSSRRDALASYTPALLAFILIASPLYGQSEYLTPDGEGEITFAPGLRVQPRYLRLDSDANSDIFIRRLRIKAAGSVYGIATYYAEVKFDNVARFAIIPRAEVENAWLQFPVTPDLAVRVGLYDAVFSRDALTSDSKLLFMDRSLIKGALTLLGLADNSVGVLAHGRPFGGHFEYSAGIFDNVRFEVFTEETGAAFRESDGLMPMGRVVAHLLDPAPALGYADYRGSYIGQGKRLAIGANAAYLSSVRVQDTAGTTIFDLYGWGADLFFNYYAVTVQAEYDRYTRKMVADEPDINGYGWYVQAGHLFLERFEIALRHQELDDSSITPDDTVIRSSVGFNVYIREHNLKLQSDWAFRVEQGGSGVRDNFVQIQLQFDF